VSRSPAAITITANKGAVATYPPTFTVAAGETDTLSFDWTAPTVSRPLYVDWVATVSADGDVNQANDSLSVTTKVTPGNAKNR
jgi:hypothetical protein